MMNISFSIDDVIESLLWLERNQAKTIFDSWTYAFAEWLHNEYGISTTCNCLYTNGVDSLSIITERYREQFEANSEWLKFSFHGWGYEKRYNNVTYEEADRDIKIVESNIVRICGCYSLSKVVRIHCFSGNDEAVEAWVNNGVNEFLTADDDRYGQGENYNLTCEEIADLKRHHSIIKNNIVFTRSDIRLENIYKRNALIYPDNGFDNIVIFTHERFINQPWVKYTLGSILESLL